MSHDLAAFATFVQELSFAALDRHNRAEYSRVARDAVELCRLAHEPRLTDDDRRRLVNATAGHYGYTCAVGDDWLWHDGGSRDHLRIPRLGKPKPQDDPTTSRHLTLIHWHQEDCGPPATWEWVLHSDTLDPSARQAEFEQGFTLVMRATVAQHEADDEAMDWNLHSPDFLADLSRRGIKPWHGPVEHVIHDFYEDGLSFADDEQDYELLAAGELSRDSAFRIIVAAVLDGRGGRVEARLTHKILEDCYPSLPKARIASALDLLYGSDVIDYDGECYLSQSQKEAPCPA